MKIRLDWPDKELSPNARLHWTKVSKAKKRYRSLSHFDTIAQGCKDWLIPVGPLRLELTFYRPTRRSYDRDNLVARMKSGLDGICDALRIDDKRFATVVARVADEVGGYVEVEIFEDTR